MFTGSTKLPPAKTPQPERLDEVYAALRRGLQSYLQVHQLELDSLGHQVRENKRNGRLGSLYEQDKQVKAIERFMRRLEFHLSKVEELYDAYCIQRRLRDGASKMVAAFNSAAGSKEARESQNEANRGYRECTEHMCSLESEIESQMGEFHVKMKGLAGFARLCAGDQYEVLMRYGRQRWRLRGRVEVSNKQIWDSEEYIFLPLVTELLSIKVTELKSLANHVVVGSVSCEMLDLFCPLPQTLAVDINDLGTVKLNLEVTWSPFDKDDQTSSSSTVSKRLLSNQSPPDTPSMREQVFYSAPCSGSRQSRSLEKAFPNRTADRARFLRWESNRQLPPSVSPQPSLLKRQGELENGTVWSNSSESSDDSSSPALAHHAQRLTASNVLQTTLTVSCGPHKSTASTPSLSSNQEEDETEVGDVFPPTDAVSNGHLQSSCSDCLAGKSGSDCPANRRSSVPSEDLSEVSAELSFSCPEESSMSTASSEKRADINSPCEDSSSQAEQTEADTQDRDRAEAAERHQNSPQESMQLLKQAEETPTAPFPASASFNQEVETALESFDFLNDSDFNEDEEDRPQEEEKVEEEEQCGERIEDQIKTEEETNNKEEKNTENLCSTDSDDEEGNDLEILMEAPEGFRNSDEDCRSGSQASSVEDEQDLGLVEIPKAEDEISKDTGVEEETSQEL
ncbi:rho family-interacting cell polarization regulator 1 isoform X1 [Oryzias latipes]|uniref:rho family-interacting cell polarization regulator 1 isoform X1 n=1 Tax=Oryzias latipes TaxID=8090 RepID=UPI000CE274BB|nr:rho family-interacting cell polarization regulator 1 isoform X1 [Oryzias latipes]XP_023809262.1 rho family-interacting cell polarization regulator 1 isoform X1 [Oryzias latipes]